MSWPFDNIHLFCVCCSNLCHGVSYVGVSSLVPLENFPMVFKSGVVFSYAGFYSTHRFHLIKLIVIGFLCEKCTPSVFHRYWHFRARRAIHRAADVHQPKKSLLCTCTLCMFSRTMMCRLLPRPVLNLASMIFEAVSNVCASWRGCWRACATYRLQHRSIELLEGVTY